MSKDFTIDAERKKCVTPECRGSYVSILEKRPLPQSEVEAYGMQLMLPKSPVVEAFVKELKKIYAQVLIDKFGREKAVAIGKAIAVNGKFPVRDGDDDKSAALANAEELKGHYFINSNNRFKQPFIIGPAGKALVAADLTPDDIYSGAWYRCMLEFWYYDTAGNKGISTSLAGIMKTKDDDNLGAGTSKTEAESEFSDFASEAASMFDTGDEAGQEEVKDDADEFDFM